MRLVRISTLITISLLFWQGNSKNRECGLSALGVLLENQAIKLLSNFIFKLIFFQYIKSLVKFKQYIWSSGYGCTKTEEI